MGAPSLFAVCSGMVAVALPSGAFAQAMPEPVLPPVTLAFMAAPPARVSHQPPAHLEVGNQVFDGSLSGFRTYLDTQRATNPQLFSQLDPQVRDLESQATAARGVAVAGMVVALVSIVYAVAGQKTCNGPPITDPNITADLQAWGACNSDNGTHIATFMLLGVGSFTLGWIGWYALSPGRSDVLSLVNAHNRISHEPIRLQLGYDPTNRLALGGVSTVF
jgi:hypothetical protein